MLAQLAPPTSGTELACSSARMKFLPSILLLSLLLPNAASADNVQALIDEISSRRVDMERLDEASAVLLREKRRIEWDLEDGARRIQRHKETHPAGKILPDLELGRMLAQSRDLSERLAELGRQINQLESEKRNTRQGLLDLYERLVERLAGQARQSQGERRGGLLALLQRVRAERDALRDNPADAPLRPDRLFEESLLASDDPEELSESADAVRDEQDRLRRELLRLDRAVAQQQADRRLEMEMRDFLSERSVFGEESRTLKLGSSSPAGKTNAQNTDRDTPPIGFEGGGGYDAGAGLPGAGGAASGDPLSGRTPMALDPDGIPATRSDPGDTSSIQARRQQIVERLKKLQLLHDRLRDKAETLLEQP